MIKTKVPKKLRWVALNHKPTLWCA